MTASLDVPLENRTRRDLLELAIGYGLILAVIWTPRPMQRYLYMAALVFLGSVIWNTFHSWQAMGFRITNLLRSLWIPLLALAVAGVALLVSFRFQDLHAPDTVRLFVRSFWGYALWSLVQQMLLQDFFLSRLQRLLPRPGLAILTAAGIFAVAHLPNPILTPATFVWGAIACALFLRYRNLYPLGVAHAILGITLAIAIPNQVIHNMRVGLGYINYRAPGHRSQVPHTVSTKAWVIADAPTRRS